MAKISAKLEAARSTLADINAKAAEATAKRKARLIAGDPAAAIGKLDTEIAELQHAAQTEADRIRLLESEAAREEAEAAAKRRAALTDRFAGKLAEADTLAEQLQTDIAKVEKTFRAIIALREEARAAWPAGDSHTAAIAGTPEGCAMSGPAVATLLKYELYRIGARPYAGGQQGARTEVGFPGSTSPRLDWLMTPEKITPFATALRNASRVAVEMMRGRLDPLKAIAAVAPAPGSAAEQKLGRLLSEQARLSTDISEEGEARYRAVVAQIAEVQGELAAAQTGATAA
jgi:hypothetical protein